MKSPSHPQPGPAQQGKEVVIWVPENQWFTVKINSYGRDNITNIN